MAQRFQVLPFAYLSRHNNNIAFDSSTKHYCPLCWQQIQDLGWYPFSIQPNDRPFGPSRLAWHSSANITSLKSIFRYLCIHFSLLILWCLFNGSRFKNFNILPSVFKVLHRTVLPIFLKWFLFVCFFLRLTTMNRIFDGSIVKIYIFRYF